MYGKPSFKNIAWLRLLLRRDAKKYAGLTATAAASLLREEEDSFLGIASSSPFPFDV